MESVKIPESIEKKMRMWRRGVISIPQEYIQFHKDLAEKALKEMPSIVTVHRTYMADDGWLDGMQFLHAIIETGRGKLHKIKWCDSQHFMEEMPSGGWGLFRVEKS